MFFQAGVKHIILAVSYRAELLEEELKVEEQKVCITDSKDGLVNDVSTLLICNHSYCYLPCIARNVITF